MTKNRPNRNQEPEPVRHWFARLFHRRPQTLERPLPRNSEALAAILRQAEALRTAREEAARWKRHADTYAEERDTAIAAFNAKVLEVEDRTKERDGAYGERAQLLAWLAALHPATTVITASPDVDEDGWQLLYLVAGGWQMSWHIHPRDRELFRHVNVVDVTDRRAQWDGHGTVQKYERIRNHVRLLALDTVADGPLTDATTSADTVCERCKGSAIDPEDSTAADFSMSPPEPPVLEPCRACQYPPITAEPHGA